MAEDIKCACESTNVALFSCSGASNVGQLSNQLAIELTEKGIGKMMCAVGIGGQVTGILRSAEGCDRIIAIDGCPLNCTKKTLELAGLEVDRHILVTDLGISKNKDLRVKGPEFADILEKVSEILAN
ncbi:putative zinc-binding protein [Methanococcoides sp. AM1]|uniref:putative zinc-binding protein n=1 Tax=Methanococcoides sp. AM1 TaxID=1201011 RepID=UPI00108329CE|nr:putative zinc-binding protein [Methanococcoides sp. AM1]